MSKFIKLHTFEGGEILINTDNILFVIANINDDAKGANATVRLGSLTSVETSETLEEIEQMLMH